MLGLGVLRCGRVASEHHVEPAQWHDQRPRVPVARAVGDGHGVAGDGDTARERERDTAGLSLGLCEGQLLRHLHHRERRLRIEAVCVVQVPTGHLVVEVHKRQIVRLRQIRRRLRVVDEHRSSGPPGLQIRVVLQQLLQGPEARRVLFLAGAVRFCRHHDVRLRGVDKEEVLTMDEGDPILLRQSSLAVEEVVANRWLPWRRDLHIGGKVHLADRVEVTRLVGAALEIPGPRRPRVEDHSDAVADDDGLGVLGPCYDLPDECVVPGHVDLRRAQVTPLYAIGRRQPRPRPQVGGERLLAREGPLVPSFAVERGRPDQDLGMPDVLLDLHVAAIEAANIPASLDAMPARDDDELAVAHEQRRVDHHGVARHAAEGQAHVDGHVVDAARRGEVGQRSGRWLRVRQEAEAAEGGGHDEGHG
mmetsp:Transcript_20029/g.58160  ORF Transcript_20029/g.58160 Transcript_20029/m.58160 type:complete len:418 (-) Transcript_20029:3595-4848(-)